MVELLLFSKLLERWAASQCLMSGQRQLHDLFASVSHAFVEMIECICKLYSDVRRLLMFMLDILGYLDFINFH